MAKTTFILIDGDRTNTYGFRIDLSGLSLDRFNANPVMLYQHNGEVIGKWDNVRIEENKLKADADFDLEDEAGKKTAGKVKRGYLKGASVGIIINEMIINDTEHLAAKTELLEASIVSVPAYMQERGTALQRICRNAEHTTETSVVKDFKSIKDINEEFEIEGTVWSAPDSTGTQHPQVTFKGKKNNKTKIQEQSGSTLLQVQNIKSAVKGESVAEQATHLETIRWSFGDTVRLIITLSAMIFLIIIYFKFLKK